jgi:hypothetical protein
VGIHHGFDGLHHQLGVDGDADPHVVDGVACLAYAGAVDPGHIDSLGVQQLAFDVPQPVLTDKAVEVDAADMLGRAGHRGCGQRHVGRGYQNAAA